MFEKIKKIFKSYAFNIFLVVFFTILVLWFTLKDNYNEISTLLYKADLKWIIVILFITILIQVAVGLALKLLCSLSNPEYSLKQGFINAYIASFFHGVTPSASGGQFVQVYIFKKQGVGISNSASILWMDFIIYQSTMVLLVLVLLLLRMNHFSSGFKHLYYLIILGFIVNSFVIVSLWVLGKFDRVYKWITTTGLNILSKLKIVKDKEKSLNKLNAGLEAYKKQSNILINHKVLIFKVALVNVVRLLMYYSIPFFCAKALHINVSINSLIDIIALSSYVSMINAFIPVPGASGGTEAVFILMFGLIFKNIEASSIMIVWRFATYYFSLIVGGLIFIYSKKRETL